MSKLIGQITITETDDGFTVEVKGKKFEEFCSCGCLPLAGCCVSSQADCCQPSKKN